MVCYQINIFIEYLIREKRAPIISTICWFSQLRIERVDSINHTELIENEFVSRHRLIDNEPEEMFTNPTDPFQFILLSAPEIHFSQIQYTLLNPTECRIISLILLFIDLVTFILLTFSPARFEEIFSERWSIYGNFLLTRKTRSVFINESAVISKKTNHRDNN